MFLRFTLLILFLYLCAPNSLPQDEVTSYLEGANITGIKYESGDVWVSTYGQGIYRYSKKDDQWTNFSVSEGNLDNDLFFNIAVNKDYVWTGIMRGFLHRIFPKCFFSRPCPVSDNGAGTKA